MKKIIFALLISTWLAGCSNQMGLDPVTSVSKFDGQTTVSIQPHGTDCCMSIGAVWGDKIPDMVVLELTIYAQYMNLAKAELNIDNRIIELKPVGSMTDFRQMFPGGSVDMPTSTRGFAISLSDLRSVILAQTSMIRLTTLSNGAIIGTIKDGQKDTAAYYALQRFIAKLPQQ